MRFWLLGLALILFSSGVGLFFLVSFLPPEISASLVMVNLSYFFVLLWLFLASLTSLVLYSASFVFRRLTRKIEPRTEDKRPKFFLKTSLRRSFLFSTLVCVLLVFRLLNIFNLLNLALLVGIFGLFEVYLSSH